LHQGRKSITLTIKIRCECPALRLAVGGRTVRAAIERALRTEIKIVRSALGLEIAYMIAPAGGQTSGKDVTAAMQGELATQVLEGCNSELTSTAPRFTPGEGRLLACLYAYEDELLGQSEHALYDAAARLERAIGAITYVADECRGKLETHCTGVEVGDGRVGQFEPVAGTGEDCLPAIMNQETRSHEAGRETRGYRFETGHCSCWTRKAHRSCGSGAAIDHARR
jgi:hypothetical protein